MKRLYANPKYWLTAVLIGAWWLFHQTIPYRFKIPICRTMGRIAYHLFPSRRHVAKVNLSLCFPVLSEPERDAMVRRNFEYLFSSIIECGISWWGKDDGVLDNTRIDGFEHLHNALAQGRGVILIGAHFLTLEMGAVLIRRYIGQEHALHVVYKTQKNELFNEVMLRGRNRHMASCINAKNTKQIIRTVRSNDIVWYAPDHDHGPNSTVFAPFFGHPAATLTTTATLARISRAPVLMMATYRNSDDNGYCLRFQAPLDDFPGGNDLQDATRVNGEIEKAIAEAPEQYMWIHRRFKTQPGLKKSQLYAKNPH